jgi:hypothetical protein
MINDYSHLFERFTGGIFHTGERQLVERQLVERQLGVVNWAQRQLVAATISRTRNWSQDYN